MADDDIGVAGVINLRFKKGVSDELIKIAIENIYLANREKLCGMNWFEFRDGVQGSYDFKKWINEYHELRGP